MSRNATEFLTKGKLIRAARMITGETQTEFAEHLGYTAGYISKLEYDLQAPSLEFAIRLKEQYHIDLLFENEPSPPLKAKPKKDIDENTT